MRTFSRALVVTSVFLVVGCDGETTGSGGGGTGGTDGSGASGGAGGSGSTSTADATSTGAGTTASSTSTATGGGLAAFGESCMTGADCASGVCHNFPSKGGLLCTEECTPQTADQCPPPSSGCNNQGYCKPD